jgi:adenine-specific DNA-methyltransferase
VAIEYLGNKSRLLAFVAAPIAALPGVRSVADVFCGTASVSHALGRHGFRVLASDHMELCATLAEAALLGDGTPPFERLVGEVSRRSGETMYDAVLRRLNGLAPEDGFFLRTYSPASAATGTARMYLTEMNAAKVDAIRAQIERWAPLLSRSDRAILLRDLVSAVAAVSNTAGTYGCYLKTWKARARSPLLVKRGDTTPVGVSPHGRHEVRCDDVEVVAGALTDIDAVYLDPPYTKRQYAAYYHLLETLVSGATPDVEGSTGLPRWQDKQSDFCHRRRAPGALARLVAMLDVEHVFLSYSDDGHIAHAEILEILGQRGTTRYWEQRSPRYRSSALRHSASSVSERLYHLAVR